MTTVDLAHPFTGRWLVQNSPANRVPSHGTHAFASSYAIDFVPLAATGGTARTAPVRWRTWVQPEPPTAFPGYGRPILAPISGLVVGVEDGMPDHGAYRGIPSLGYALTQARRVAAGWAALAGNHVLIRIPCGPVIALCHLQQGSLQVTRDDIVTAGQPVAACGNSGNSTEPHVHVQAIDDADPKRAHAVPITFNGHLPANGTVVDA